jgi:hypothetical protein
MPAQTIQRISVRQIKSEGRPQRSPKETAAVNPGKSRTLPRMDRLERGSYTPRSCERSWRCIAAGRYGPEARIHRPQGTVSHRNRASVMHTTHSSRQPWRSGQSEQSLTRRSGSAIALLTAA